MMSWRPTPSIATSFGLVGLAGARGLRFRPPTGDVLFLAVEREPAARGPAKAAIIQQLDALRPHLARSALTSATATVEAGACRPPKRSSLIGLPALVFDNHGKVLAANHLIEAILNKSSGARKIACR